MGTVNIDGLKLTPLKIISNELGDVLHGIKADDDGFAGFGEAYFSTVKEKVIKNWKKHHKMILNLVVPVGKIKFVAFDDRKNSPSQGNLFEVELSRDNYQRLTVPSGIWLAFQGKGEGLNMLLNLASIKHDPAEAENIEINTPQIPYHNW